MTSSLAVVAGCMATVGAALAAGPTDANAAAIPAGIAAAANVLTALSVSADMSLYLEKCTRPAGKGAMMRT